ncbi:sensor histidine kinase [Paenibacillus arenilitoris]|uniref:histidine kinase n=1 Tax=Paenibacillus arenilitoris TaxID=2772299 RepID=A0A927CI54_9BACL|nr:HAMP domain-containing sensor histidine kinase [Paenibacillus arenilitoris]MBD2867097.1 HAMP domain-containing histidine kinase [Paenibacillus arenilitoris]
MTISIKLKFSIFLAVLLLLTVFLLSLLVLAGIKQNQQAQAEQYLAQQAATANTYFIQTLMAEASKVPQTFLASKGEAFAEQLALMTGHTVVLYDGNGRLLNRQSGSPLPDNLAKTLAFALDRKAAYLTEGDSLYYLSPLWTGGEQVGVVQFNYSLAANQTFYDEIRRLFALMGAGVFVLSFLLAYVYFNSFAASIIRLNLAIDGIRDGRFDAETLPRRDEIGELSEGIRAMSSQIKKTLRDNEAEREKLSLAVHKLSLLDRQQKQFIGSVTHEFKTPLTSIKAYMDLLDMYPDDEQLLVNAKAAVQSETQRLYEMVEKVLQLSALDKYEFEFSKEKIDVREAIHAVLHSLKGKMEKFGIRLDTDLTEAYVEADKDSMTILLVNLLDNAIKYNKANGRIHVRNELRDGKVIIEIADTGIGIPDEVKDKIFEPFYTVDKNRSRENGGAGLGLSLAKQYADSQGGTLTLDRTGSEGTSFILTFPAY